MDEEVRDVAWYRVAELGELSDESVIAVQAGGVELAVYKVAGVVYATSNLCTHDVARLSEGYIDGDCIECPLHQALFHIPTGEARSAPATRPLQTYETKVEGGGITVSIPDASDMARGDG